MLGSGNTHFRARKLSSFHQHHDVWRHRTIASHRFKCFNDIVSYLDSYPSDLKMVAALFSHWETGHIIDDCLL